jgi:hypothetical protein
MPDGLAIRPTSDPETREFTLGKGGFGSTQRPAAVRLLG